MIEYRGQTESERWVIGFPEGEQQNLDKSSIFLALQRVLDISAPEPPLYAGPKAIGQIFEIS